MSQPTFNAGNLKPKTFWQRPEGITGLIFLAAIAAFLVWIFGTYGAFLIGAVSNVIYLSAMLAVLAGLVYVILDPKMRNLIWYMYKSVMRWLTGWFVTIDPIGILKSYVEDLESNLRKMSEQIGNLRGQMRKLQGIMDENSRQIDQNLKLASAAKDKDMDQQMVLNSRKAARLQETNEKYAALHSKMEIMHRILTKMYSNSEILLEDTKDQVRVKEQERQAIRTSHSAMKSAMSVISGDPDKRAMFDMAMEAIADDVAMKVGEMERFMELSSNFMNSVDLQNGVFEEEGLRMLEQYEKQSNLLLMGKGKSETLDLNSPSAQPQLRGNDQKSGGASSSSQYDNLFDQ